MTNLEFLFHPRSIAIVGTPSDPRDMSGGAAFLHALTRSGYVGDIWPVNPKADEIMGLKSYPNLMSLPQTPDYVICCLPAPLTVQLIKDCAVKGVRAVSIFSAGFSEASEEGRKLEEELVNLARQGGVRLIGPNCMGIYCPSTGLSYYSESSKEPGSVGFLCQSGGNSTLLVLMGGDRGIRFSKVISYGNAADLNEADFLEYLTQDSETEIIAVYIEGVRDGRRFLQALATAARTKLVIMVKGGRTEAGGRAASSHTGSLASSKEGWDALCQQAGVVEVSTLGEVLDVIEAALYLKLPKGSRVGIIGWGGGVSVTSADACEAAGLIVPSFSSELRQKLRMLTSEPGSSVANPVDSAVVTNPSLLSKTMRIIANSSEIDLLLMHMPFAVPSSVDSEWRRLHRETVLETSGSLDIPIAVVQPHSATPESSAIFSALQHRCLEAGIPLYPTATQAAGGISRFIQYHMRKSRE